MPDGVRNGISSTDKTGIDDGEWGEPEDADIATKLPPKTSNNLDLIFDLFANSSNTCTTTNGTNLTDKSDRNGNSSQRLKLCSGARDADYVMLALTQKQRQSDDILALIETLRHSGVSCLFIRNHALKTSNDTKSPCGDTLIPDMTTRLPSLLTNSNLTSCSSLVQNQTKLFNGVHSPSELPPSPVSVASTPTIQLQNEVHAPEEEAPALPVSGALALGPPIHHPPIPPASHLKKKRRRRKKDPYVTRKSAKKKKIVLEQNMATTLNDKEDNISNALTVVETKVQELTLNMNECNSSDKDITPEKSSEDPYVFIPEEESIDQPLPLLFSPKSLKNIPTSDVDLDLNGAVDVVLEVKVPLAVLKRRNKKAKKVKVKAKFKSPKKRKKSDVSPDISFAIPEVKRARVVDYTEMDSEDEDDLEFCNEAPEELLPSPPPPPLPLKVIKKKRKAGGKRRKKGSVGKKKVQIIEEVQEDQCVQTISALNSELSSENCVKEEQVKDEEANVKIEKNNEEVEINQIDDKINHEENKSVQDEVKTEGIEVEADDDDEVMCGDIQGIIAAIDQSLKDPPETDIPVPEIEIKQTPVLIPIVNGIRDDFKDSDNEASSKINVNDGDGDSIVDPDSEIIVKSEPLNENGVTESLFMEAMQLRRPSFYSQIAGNVRNNLEKHLDGRFVEPKLPGRRRKRARNGFLLHHGDNFPEDPEAPYKLHLATQIILKLNKRRSKLKPKEDKAGKSLLSYLKLIPKRVSRGGKKMTERELLENEVQVPNGETESTSVFSGEWIQERNFICNVCGHIETYFWDMVTHKGEMHPGVVVTHVELPDAPPIGFRFPPAVPKGDTTQTSAPPCSKCNQTFASHSELHRHIFECAGNGAWLEELKVQESPRKRKAKRKRGFNSFKRRLSNTPRKKAEGPSQKRREIFKCEFCTREFKTEGWLKNHVTTHSLPISIPLSKLTSLPPTRASITSTSALAPLLFVPPSPIGGGRRNCIQTLIANKT